MKNNKMFAFILLACFSFLLSGCGGGSSKKLVCTRSSNEGDMELTVYFNNAETKIEKVEVELETEMPSEISAEYEKQIVDLTVSQCEKAGAKKCKASLKGKKLYTSFEQEKFGEVDTNDVSSLADAKKQFAEYGFECK